MLSCSQRPSLDATSFVCSTTDLSSKLQARGFLFDPRDNVPWGLLCILRLHALSQIHEDDFRLEWDSCVNCNSLKQNHIPLLVDIICQGNISSTSLSNFLRHIWPRRLLLLHLSLNLRLGSSVAGQQKMGLCSEPLWDVKHELSAWARLR